MWGCGISEVLQAVVTAEGDLHCGSEDSSLLGAVPGWWPGMWGMRSRVSEELAGEKQEPMVWI